MARRIIEPTVLEVSGDLSGDYISKSFNIVHADNVGIHLIWDGTPTGEFFVEASIDGEAWDSLALSPSIGAAAGPGSSLVNLQKVPYAMLRVFYQRSTGTGTVKINMMAKQSGG